MNYPPQQYTVPLGNSSVVTVSPNFSANMPVSNGSYVPAHTTEVGTYNYLGSVGSLNRDFINAFPNQDDRAIVRIASNPEFYSQSKQDLMKVYHQAAKHLVRNYHRYRNANFLNHRLDLLQQANFDFNRYPDIYQSADNEAREILRARGIR